MKSQNQNYDNYQYTSYQTSYLAHWLTLKGHAEDSVTKSLVNAKIEVKPHQVEAAIFALASPLSKGVLLADEVGLGKTIEAGLIMAQNLAERKRKILLIVPAMLRSQWSRELLEKFYIHSLILEKSTYKKAKANGHDNPFNLNPPEKVVICSYEFAAAKSQDLKNVAWDIVFFDEAHKLRNIWKKKWRKEGENFKISLRKS